MTLRDAGNHITQWKESQPKWRRMVWGFLKVKSWRDGEGLHEWLSIHPYSKQRPEQWVGMSKKWGYFGTKSWVIKRQTMSCYFFIWICVRIPAFVSQVHTYICSPLNTDKNLIFSNSIRDITSHSEGWRCGFQVSDQTSEYCNLFQNQKQ